MRKLEAPEEFIAMLESAAECFAGIGATAPWTQLKAAGAAVPLWLYLSKTLVALGASPCSFR